MQLRFSGAVQAVQQLPCLDQPSDQLQPANALCDVSHIIGIFDHIMAQALLRREDSHVHVCKSD